MNVQEILKDGIIDAVETAEIRKEIYADGSVSTEEVEQLFALKDGATETCQEFKDLVVEATMDCLLADGEIDEKEIAWIKGLIESDGEIDEVEQQILLRL